MLQPADGAALLFELRSEDAGSRIVVEGELDFAAAPRLLEAASDALDGRHGVTVDLRPLTFLDSAGVGALIGLCRSIRSSGRRVYIVAPKSPSVARIIELAGAGEELGRTVTPLSSTR